MDRARGDLNKPVRKVAILIFDEVEVLDFCGPFEVFSLAGRSLNEKPFEVFTVAEGAGPVVARNGLSVNPRCTIAACPQPDILIVPGGYGTRREMHNHALTDWIRAQAEKAELVMSVCTGALLLARAGLLDGLAATTHFGALDLLCETAPHTLIQPGQRFIDNGRVLVSAGVSAGIDLSFHIVQRLLGHEVAAETARWMEYDWKGNAAQ
jgi:transcriptional regulator GlxA family with amidase domain